MQQVSLSKWLIIGAFSINSVDPDLAVPIGAVRTVSTMFASTFTLKLVILLANTMHAVKPSNEFLLALYRLIKT